MEQKVLNVALSYEGTTYDKNNNIPFVTAYYGKPMNSKVAYCCIFVWYILDRLGLSKAFYGGKKTASCTTLLKYCKSNKDIVVHTDIDRCIPGRTLVFYNFKNNGKANHIGIFHSKSVVSKHFYAIEGNTSGPLGSQDNGGYVMKKHRSLSKVMAFATLDYGQTCPFEEPTTTVAKGSKGNDAGWVQWQLNRKSYYCDIDQSIGSASEKVIKKFQAANKLEVDGRVGKATRAALKS